MNGRVKKLRKENNVLEESFEFSEEAEKSLTDMIVYIRGSRMNEYNQELVSRDITNMVIEGEKRGSSIKEIIGDDYKEFCDDVISEIPRMTLGEQVLYNFGIVCKVLSVLSFIWVVTSIVGYFLRIDELPYVSVTLGGVLIVMLIVVVSYVVTFSICRGAFEQLKIVNGIALIFIAMLLMISAMLLLDKVLFEMHVAVLFAIGVILTVMSKVIDYRM